MMLAIFSFLSIRFSFLVNIRGFLNFSSFFNFFSLFFSAFLFFEVGLSLGLVFFIFFEGVDLASASSSSPSPSSRFLLFDSLLSLFLVVLSWCFFFLIAFLASFSSLERIGLSFFFLFPMVRRETDTNQRERIRSNTRSPLRSETKRKQKITLAN